MPVYGLRTDKRRVERIIVNLTENALSHGTAPVTITIQRRSPAIDRMVAGTVSGRCHGRRCDRQRPRDP